MLRLLTSGCGPEPDLAAVRRRASTCYLMSPESASSCLGFETVAFAGLGAPKGTPADVIEKLNRKVNLGLADPKLKQRIIDLGGEPLQLSAAEFGKFVAEETDKWGRVVKFSGAKSN